MTEYERLHAEIQTWRAEAARLQRIGLEQVAEYERAMRDLEQRRQAERAVHLASEAELGRTIQHLRDQLRAALATRTT